MIAKNISLKKGKNQILNDITLEFPILRKLRDQGKDIVISTHDMNFAIQVAEKTYTLE